MRWLLVVLCACQGKSTKQEPPPPPNPADAAIDAAPDWTAACADALTAKLAPVRKLSSVIAACAPCGDWKPLLAWQTPATEGGPREQAILDAMDACKAYCTKDAKMQFANALPDAREKQTNKPWKVLGEKCKAEVSALPDERFLSAPYFALDRIARAAAADAKLAPLLAAFEVPLPAWSITGVGFELPTSTVTKPEPPRIHLTVTAAELRMGMLPRAKLTADGVVVNHGSMPPYPGELYKLGEIASKLHPGEPIGVIAPAALPASRVAEVVRAANERNPGSELVLVVATAGGPPGWTLPGIVPIALDAAPDPKKTAWALDANVDATIADLKSKPAEAFDHPRIVIGKDATVEHLAKLLGALAFRDARSASLVVAK